VANSVYCWTPLFSAHIHVKPEEQVRRMALFLDAYGLEDRSELLLTLRTRLQFVADVITREAAAGDPGMQRLVAMNVPKTMFEDAIRALDDNWARLERAL
jgi:hypothetical protein